MRISIIILLLFVAVSVMGADSNPDYNTEYRSGGRTDELGGANTPIMYSGSNTLGAGTGSSTTRWMQIGYVPHTSSTSTLQEQEMISRTPATGDALHWNRILSDLNPENFTIDIKLSCSGDSGNLATAYFEFAWDTTETDMIALTLTDQDSTYILNEIVTGSVSGATGRIKYTDADPAGVLYLYGVEGVFDASGNEIAVGSESGARDPIASKSSIADRSGWAADSSNHFIGDYYTHPQYGQWRFEDYPPTYPTAVLPDTSRWYRHTCRTLAGGFIRIVWTGPTDVADYLYIDWILICEH